MSVDRVIRARSVEYKINFLQRKKEVYVYLGSTWVGRIIYRVDDPMRRDPHYGVYIQLPGCWGPVAREDTVHEAKIAASAALRKWLETFTQTPTDPEERPEKVVGTRITRTRAPAHVAKRITRSRS